MTHTQSIAIALAIEEYYRSSAKNGLSAKERRRIGNAVWHGLFVALMTGRLSADALFCSPKLRHQAILVLVRAARTGAVPLVRSTRNVPREMRALLMGILSLKEWEVLGALQTGMPVATASRYYNVTSGDIAAVARWLALDN